jgi:hypothetical protein
MTGPSKFKKDLTPGNSKAKDRVKGWPAPLWDRDPDLVPLDNGGLVA